MKKKTLLAMFISLFLVIACNGQPNTSTTIQIGIIDELPDKTYLVFAELKDDSLSGSRLINNMDYLEPNDVSDLMLVLTNPYIVADTTFYDYEYPDIDIPQYVKGGLVQVDGTSFKYSAMTTSYWVETDSIEPNQAGFIFRKKQ